MSERKPTFAGECQFAGYTDSSRGGPRITLRLADRDELQKFIGNEGKRYMAVLVEIADDETPAAPPAPAPAARKAAAPRERMAPLCEWAVMRCAEPEFQQWCMDVWDRGDLAELTDQYDMLPKTNDRQGWAKFVLLTLCGVTSRRHLDLNPEAAKRFHERVRAPYAAWLERQGVPA